MKNQIEKNLPILANCSANLLGVVMISLVQGNIVERLIPDASVRTEAVSMIFDPLAFSLCFILALIYEKPIRKCFTYGDVTKAPPAILAQARKRVLTTPYFYMGMNLTCWLAAAIVFPAVLKLDGAPLFLVVRTTAQCIIIGIITCGLAFFLVETILQRFFMIRFFPAGGVFAIKGVPRTLIITRLFVLFIITGFVPCIVSLFMASGMQRVLETTELAPLEVVHLFSSALVVNACIFIGAGLALVLLVSMTLARPFRDIVAVLQRIRDGNLDVWLPIHSTDEVGYTCDSINQMAGGLREKERLRHSLDLAGTVQRSLLPKGPPVIPGLDIAGISLPCDETGGDYYDYIKRGENGEALDVVVGDVVGHGISSALLMTSVRAMIRTRSELGGSHSEIIKDVNRHLCEDVADSGNFMTLFYLRYQAVTKTMTWVRAGHEPALLHNPVDDTFIELKEGGPSLGVIPDASFSSGRKSLSEGMILLLATDGITETRSPGNELFGKERLKEIIRLNSHKSAQEILDELLAAITTFREGNPAEDDITAVVIKGASSSNAL